jgi:hypothetical protein
VNPGINVYDELTEGEKQEIQKYARELSSLLGIWASCYPIIRSKRAAPVAVLIATVLPDLQPRLSLLVGKLILLIFAIDDVADERILSYEEFIQASKDWEEIARTGYSNRLSLIDSDLSGMVAEIRSELAQCPLFVELGGLWADQIRMLCKAMAKEYEYGLRYQISGKESLPPLDEYISGGIYSVGFPFWGTSVLILLSEPEIMRQLERITDLISSTGAAIRLYNDVRTYEKEVQESNINSITIAQNMLEKSQPSLPAQEKFNQARNRVMSMANQYAEKCYKLNASIQTGSGQFEQMIHRIVAFHAYFYGSQQHNKDYHTISSNDSFSMINNT